MTRKPLKGFKLHRRATSSRPGAYEVGYGRPPEQHRFKPGQSGNKQGRPKGRKNESTILQELFNTRVRIRDGARVRSITLLEALLRKFLEDALKGNPKSATFLLTRLQNSSTPTDEPGEASVDDREILEAFARKLQSQLNKKD